MKNIIIALKDKTLRAAFAVSLILCIGIPFLITAFIHPGYKSFIVSNAEDDAVLLAAHLISDEIYDKIPLDKKSFGVTAHEKFETIKGDFGLYKLKIFSADGEIVFSTSPGEIGQINKKSYFHEIVSKGNNFTKVVRKDTKSLEDQMVSLDVVECYVPIMTSGIFSGAFEIYFDVTSRFDAIRSLYLKSMTLVLSLSGVILTYMFISLWFAGRQIDLKRLSEKRFRSLFEESKDAIVSTDRDGNLQMINPAGMELFDLADTDRKLANFLDFYIEQDMPRKFLAGMSEKGYVRDFGVQLKGKEGRPMDCLMTVNAKQSSDGKVVGYEGIIRDVTPYKRMEEKLRKLATTDSLTGINNRRNFVELAQKEISRSKRYGNPLSLVMLDIDHFKKINDTYGHSSGDQVLIEFCELCLKEIRESDIMGRLGGEEFAIALVNSNAETAGVVAERINRSASSCPVTVNGQQICFTVSIGVTVLCPDDDLDSILERSDKALYQAKKNGRNHVRTCVLTDK